ncbi:hypothetical protein A3C87_02640 [Candidatus Kaiserbacteria bacterium RIFCSPHIGHO2_02_FULL_49_34]|uniref:MBL fold hydrolase n=1 Tax=Candidatus Kaiserbacteria bacterium RIFCSPHIGHO2_02_FULL_49_34 TaxID=1798491 RepID=A0A1F6DJD3_9BACT|nr:MAG: hypothetical protein A3C87_02640 [Candidatus Kaiserbacteria bacterium RIFCSPHIGHO2_02_FULL_49_34]
MQTKLTFWSGVHDATGANFMFETGKATLLVDCGLIQGQHRSEVNCEVFAYDAKSVDALLVTHAHADHIGRIPKLVREGFSGAIYATKATAELTQHMLADALNVMRQDAKRGGTEPCYDEHDVQRALSMFRPVSYGETISLPDDITATFTDAGHILGSAIITLKRGDKTFVASGDIGNQPQPLLGAPQIPEKYDYLIMESVYGDRAHEDVASRKAKLLAVIEEARAKNGTLIIPAFSLERTQGLLYEINNAVESGEIESIPIFLDSPLAIKVTEVYRNRPEYMREDVQEQIRNGDDIFAFPGLEVSHTKEDSEAIQHTHGAKIIIAGSGMSHGGRILAHERRYLPDPSTTVLLVGYQGVGTLGRKLQDGAKTLRIAGEEIAVRATVQTIDGYSAHADRDQLVDFVEPGAATVKKVFVAMGEEKSSLFLVQRLRDFLGVDAVAPAPSESFEIEF